MPFDPIAKKVYDGPAWKKCRESYVKSVGGLCEECLRRGTYTAGTQVHHKIKLTIDNINNPAIAYNFDNLELLCNKCHAAKHRKPRRTIVDMETGEVRVNPDWAP